ncbi:hypothetical protein TNCV_2139541 [Trichonephila clavipes]|uniref:Transposase n=1 Tax=Trichonephila clavipes TaxID=2585209 RepID=A0A8X6RRR8_TRICX|nr:hypothetical protein TNCV_2139541 [Trichonephila clavipes]
MVKKWYANLKRSHTDTNDAELSGRPNSAIVPENIKKVHEIVLADQKLKSCKIEMRMKKSKGNGFTIFHDYLSIRKLCSKWVSRLLTVDPKQKRIANSQYCSELFKQNKQVFFRRYLTMDETWIHYYPLE